MIYYFILLQKDNYTKNQQWIIRNVMHCSHFVPPNNILLTIVIFPILYSAAFLNGMMIYGISHLRSVLGSVLLSLKASHSCTQEVQLVCFHVRGCWFRTALIRAYMWNQKSRAQTELEQVLLLSLAVDLCCCLTNLCGVS